MGGDAKYGSDRSGVALEKAVEKSETDLERLAREANARAGNKPGASKAVQAKARRLFQAAVRRRNQLKSSLFRKMTGGKAKNGVGRLISAEQAAKTAQNTVKRLEKRDAKQAASRAKKKKAKRTTTARKPAKKKKK